MTEEGALSVYLAVHSSSQAVCSRWLKQLPCPSLVESDDRSHVFLAERAIDERGDIDASQPLHTVQVCKRLIGKVPETQMGYMIREFHLQISKLRGNLYFLL